MVSSIFSPAFGNRPSCLVGRDGVINDFMDGLSQEPGNRARSVVLLGQRGSGKTVLLWELADRARKLGYVVATPTTASEGMLERIVEKIQEDGARFTKHHGLHLSGGSLGALGFSVGLEFSRDIQETKTFQFKLTQLARALTSQGHGILILIDELQANSPEIRQLVSVYQELIGEGLDVALVMAGLPGAVSATLNDRVLTFLNRATKTTLQPLAFGEIDAFLAKAFAQLSLDVPEAIRHEAARQTHGSPYLLQLVGYNMALRADGSEPLGKEDLADAVAASREDFENDVCGTTLATLSEGDRLFLSAAATSGARARMKDISEKMGVTQDYAQKYRRRLIAAGVIVADGRGYVKFDVPFLREYLLQEDE